MFFVMEFFITVASWKFFRRLDVHKSWLDFSGKIYSTFSNFKNKAMIYEHPIIFFKLVRSDSKEEFYYKKHYQSHGSIRSRDQIPVKVCVR